MRAAALWVRSRLPAGRFLRGVVLLVGGSAGAQLVALLAAPLLTRLYSPADFGTSGVFVAVLALLQAVASGRYELAISLPKDEETGLDLLVLCLVLLVGSAAVCTLGVWGLGGWLLRISGSESVGAALWLLPVAVLGAGIYQALNYYGIRRKSYPRLMRTKLSQAVANVGSSLAIGLVHSGPFGLIVGGILGQSAGISTLAGEVAAAGGARFPRTTFARLVRSARTFRRFPLYLAPASLLNTAGGMMPTLLLASLFGADVAGLFGLAQRLVTSPLAPITQAVNQVFLTEAAECMQDRPAELPRLFDRVVWHLAPLCGLILAGGLVAPFVCGWFFGARWAMTGAYVLALSLFAAANLVTNPITNVTIVMRRQDVQLWLDAVRMVLVTVSLILPHRLGYSGLTAVTCYSVAMTVVYLITFLVCRNLASSLRPTPEPERGPNFS